WAVTSSTMALKGSKKLRYLQGPARLGVYAELCPRHRLHELVPRAEPAGQHDKRVSQVRHGRLPSCMVPTTCSCDNLVWPISRSSREPVIPSTTSPPARRQASASTPPGSLRPGRGTAALG